jgi:hypothetical protein
MSEWEWASWPSGDVGIGWKDIVQPVVDLCEQRGVKIAQIKEKFGSLRIYLDSVSHDDDINKAIEAAECKADITCEKCGDIGKLRDDRSWLKTLCNSCNND